MLDSEKLKESLLQICNMWFMDFRCLKLILCSCSWSIFKW